MLRKLFLFCLLFLLVTPLLRAAEVSIIYGENSLWNKKEVAFAERRANGMKRHLSRVGFDAEVYSDKDFKNAFPKECKTVNLLLCQNPSKEFVAELKKFIERGGKICVFFSDSAALAKLMDIKIDGFVKPEGKDEKWKRLVFTWPRPIHMPDDYEHVIPSVIQLIPQGDARAIGSWESTAGNKGPIGILETKNGYWVSFLPSEYANPTDYTFFVASIVGGTNPTLWRSAAQNLRMEINGTIPQKSVPALYEHYKNTPYPRLKEKMELLRALNAEIDISFSQGLFAKAVKQLCELRKELELTQALLDGRIKLRVVAVWDKSTVVAHAKNKQAAVEHLKAAGVTDVFMEMAAPGWSVVPLPNIPLLKEKSLENDVREMIALYKEAGIRTHAWIYSLNGEFMSDARWLDYKERGMTMEGVANNSSIHWLNPNHPQTRVMVGDIAVYLAKNYGFDGIHLDYIRYPDFPTNYIKSPNDKADFMEFAKLKSINWPADIAFKGKYRTQYDRWRTQNVTEVVRHVKGELKKEAPNVLFSTAVFGRYPTCIYSIGQDWEAWIDEGIVDFVVAMNYTHDIELYRELVSAQADPKYRDKIVSGIGVNSFEGMLSVTDVFHQLRFAGFKKLMGISLYSYEEYLEAEVLPALELVNDQKK